MEWPMKAGLRPWTLSCDPFEPQYEGERISMLSYGLS